MLPVVPEWQWWDPAELYHRSDGIFAACALAATLSFIEAPRNPEQVESRASSAPVNVDRLSALARARTGKAIAAEELRAAVLASEDPYVRLWADHVGRFDDRVLDATPSGLLRESAASSDEALRLALFTPSYAAPATSPRWSATAASPR